MVVLARRDGNERESCEALAPERQTTPPQTTDLGYHTEVRPTPCEELARESYTLLLRASYALPAAPLQTNQRPQGCAFPLPQEGSMQHLVSCKGRHQCLPAAPGTPAMPGCAPCGVHPPKPEIANGPRGGAAGACTDPGSRCIVEVDLVPRHGPFAAGIAHRPVAPTETPLHSGAARLRNRAARTSRVTVRTTLPSICSSVSSTSPAGGASFLGGIAVLTTTPANSTLGARCPPGEGKPSATGSYACPQSGDCGLPGHLHSGAVLSDRSRWHTCSTEAPTSLHKRKTVRVN